MLDIANTCMSCKVKPCQKGCPLSNDITGFIQFIKEEKYKKHMNYLVKLLYYKQFVEEYVHILNNAKEVV